MIKEIISEKTYKSIIPMNLQLFADEGGAGSEEGEKPPEGEEGKPPAGGEFELPKTKEDLLKLLGTETDKKVLEAIETAKAKWEEEYKTKLENEKLEAEKLSKMTAAEKEKHLLEKQKLEIANKEKELIQKEMKLAKIDIFAEKKLPIKLVDFVPGSTAEEVNKNIAAFENEWKSAIDEAVTERLKGKSPFNISSDGKTDLGVAKQLLELNKKSNNEDLQKARDFYFK